MNVKAPRGTVDILANDVAKWNWLESKAREICQCFDYKEIRTPIFEATELFLRGVGATTDIVEKEIYSFTDRGDRSLTLRPEGTAGAVRAYVEHKLYSEPGTTKWFYLGPMFRYERPQAGRYRQFHQFGIEALGSMHPALDAEVIQLGMQFYQSLGIQNVRVEVNNIGDEASRLAYREKLIAYFEPYKDQLAADAQARLYKNPLRILDTKDPVTKEIAQGAPSILDYLTDECKMHFKKLLHYLDALNVPYTVNDRLVRGLDYYTYTAFEYMSEVKGAQASTIGGGGRYNGLVKELGGPDVSGIGFSIGLERVLLALEEQNLRQLEAAGLDCYVIAMGEEADRLSVSLLQQLRENGIAADRDYLDRKMKAQMKAADRSGAKFAVIIGEEEVRTQKVQLKELKTGEQQEVAVSELIGALKK